MNTVKTICVNCKHFAYKVVMNDKDARCMFGSEAILDRNFTFGQKAISYTYMSVTRNNGDCTDYKKKRFWRSIPIIRREIILVENRYKT